MNIPKTRLVRSCETYRSEPQPGMSLAEMAAVLKEYSVLIRSVGQNMASTPGANKDLADDLVSGAVDIRRIGHELAKISGDQSLIRMDQRDRVTPCECPANGFCPRHKIDKTEHWHKLCRTKIGMFKLWEAGTGPGQSQPQNSETVNH